MLQTAQKTKRGITLIERPMARTSPSVLAISTLPEPTNEQLLDAEMLFNELLLEMEMG